MTSAPQAPRAFGLVETLAAMAVLAVLMLLTFPLVRHAREASDGARNLANQRIVAGALLAYASEHGGKLPWANDLSNAPYHTPWPKALALGGYVEDAMVFFSPKLWPRYGGAAGKAGAYAVIRNPKNYPNSVVPWGYPSYGANRYGAMPASTDARLPASLPRVGREGNLHRLMLIRDVYQSEFDTEANPRAGGVWWFSADNHLPGEQETYNGNLHAAFADGHVESFPRVKLAAVLRSGSAAPVFYNVYTNNPPN